MERCSSCGEDKPIDFFYKNTRKSNGLESQCKRCVLSSKRKKRHRRVTMKKSNSSRVLEIEACTWEEVYITRPKKNGLKIKDLVEELLWLKNQGRYEA